MNDFFRDKGVSQSYGSTWVAVPEPGAALVIAFYTISPDPVELILEYDEELEATVIELERLAVALEYQKQGVRRTLLVRVIRQTLEAADQYAIDALSLLALDDDAKRWYMSLNFGFQEITPGNPRLILPVATMRQLRRADA